MEQELQRQVEANRTHVNQSVEQMLAEQKRVRDSPRRWAQHFISRPHYRPAPP